MQDGIFHNILKNIYAIQTKKVNKLFPSFKKHRNSGVFLFSYSIFKRIGSDRFLKGAPEKQKIVSFYHKFVLFSCAHEKNTL